MNLSIISFFIGILLVVWLTLKWVLRIKNSLSSTPFSSQNSLPTSLLFFALCTKCGERSVIYSVVYVVTYSLFILIILKLFSSYFHPLSPLPFAPKWKCVYVNDKSKGRLLTFFSSKNTFLAEMDLLKCCLQESHNTITVHVHLLSNAYHLIH